MNMIKNRLRCLKYKSRVWKRKRHIRIGSGARISWDSKLDGYNYVGADAILCSVKMGQASYVGDRCIFYHARIGKYTSISSYVVTATGRHPTKKWVSTHPAFFSTLGQAGFTFADQTKFEEIKWADEDDRISVEIGNDVWIGASVIIFDGVHVGDGAVIGAGSIVMEDVPDYAVVVGRPAIIKRYRFSEPEIQFLKKIRWWDKSLDWVKEHSDYFEDISTFMKVVNQESVVP